MTGLAHYVFDVLLEDGTKVVARLARAGQENAFAGGISWSSQLRPLGVPVPRVIAADPAPPDDSRPYMLLERLPGVDHHFAYQDLTATQKRQLAHRLVQIQQRVGLLRQGEGYGYDSSHDDPSLRESWSEVLHTQIKNARTRIDAVGKVPPIHVDRVEQRVLDARQDLAQVKPMCFLDDTTTKNVLIDQGQLSGIVDVDTVCFGDPLLTPALTQMALLKSAFDTDYISFWAEALLLNLGGRRRLELYTAIFCVIFLSELGQQFNKEAFRTSTWPRSIGLSRSSTALWTKPGLSGHDPSRRLTPRWSTGIQLSLAFDVLCLAVTAEVPLATLGAGGTAQMANKDEGVLFRPYSRRSVVKTATGAAAAFYATGVAGKSYRRALAQDSIKDQILAIPGPGAGTPTDSDMERVGELVLRSQNQGKFAGQTVKFQGLSNATFHVNVFRPLSKAWEEFTGATVEWIEVTQADSYPKMSQALASDTVEFDILEASGGWEGELLGGGYAVPMPDSVKADPGYAFDDIVPYLQGPTRTWDGVTYGASVDGDMHHFNYRSDVFSNADLAAEWTSSGGEGEWGVPQTWQQVRRLLRIPQR